MADSQDGLVARLRDGDPEAVAIIYREVAPSLRAFLVSQVPHGEVADDLVELTFLELLEDRATLHGDLRSLRSWLFQAARHNLYDWRRQAARRADHELRPEHTATLPDDGPRPETVVETGDEFREVLEVMAELSPDQREVLELRLLGELPTAEVARITDRTEGAVRVLQHRGLKRLSTLIERRRAESAQCV